MHSTSVDPSQLTLLTLPLQRRTDDDAEEYVLTADFTGVRLPGDRKGIEKQTKVWDKVIVDRPEGAMELCDVYQQPPGVCPNAVLQSTRSDPMPPSPILKKYEHQSTEGSRSGQCPSNPEATDYRCPP